MKKLNNQFYRRPDVVQVARELLGKLLVTKWNDVLTSGRIVETEAYAGAMDRASHAYGAKLTPRNKVMYEAGGLSYVYLCYGIHHLFNVVTHTKGIPHAVLIRALEPVAGIETMLQRTGKEKLDYTLTRGPGNVSKALGIHTQHTGLSLTGRELFLADDGFIYPDNDIAVSGRIGVDYAGEDAKLPYRFYIRGNKNVSSYNK